MNLFFTVIVLLTLVTLFREAAKKMQIPSVVALIAAGILLGLPQIEEFIIGRHREIIFTFGDIGLLALMFLAGLEVSWRLLYEEKKDAFYIAIFAALIPFIAGTAVFLLLGYNLLISLVVGICMSITAEATKAKVLLELGKLKTKVGAAMMGAGIIDDTLGFILFLLTTYLIKGADPAEDILAIAAIGIFFAGIAAQTLIGRKKDHVKIIESGLNNIVIPFFFISMGLHFDLGSLFINSWLIVIIIAVAVLGKLGGTFLTKPFTGFSWKQLYMVGWAMNSRGAVELALVLIAFRTGVLPVKLYSAIIVMVLVTTLSFPFIITGMIRKDPAIMD